MSAQQVLSAEASRAAGLSHAAGGVSAPQPPHSIPAPVGLLPPGNNRVAPSDPDAGSGQPSRVPQHYAAWSLQEAEKLRRVWPDSSVLNEDLPAHFRRTLCSIRAKAQLMRLGARPPQCDGKRRAAEQRRLARGPEPVGTPGQFWTDEQVAILRKHWPDVDLISDETGRSVSAVEKKARNLNLVCKTGQPKGVLLDIERSYKEEMRLKVRSAVRLRIDRSCLCCRVPFVAETRFIRLCQRCRNQSEGLA